MRSVQILHVELAARDLFLSGECQIEMELPQSEIAVMVPNLHQTHQDLRTHQKYILRCGCSMPGSVMYFGLDNLFSNLNFMLPTGLRLYHFDQMFMNFDFSKNFEPRSPIGGEIRGQTLFFEAFVTRDVNIRS